MQTKTCRHSLNLKQTNNFSSGRTVVEIRPNRENRSDL